MGLLFVYAAQHPMHPAMPIGEILFWMTAVVGFTAAIIADITALVVSIRTMR